MCQEDECDVMLLIYFLLLYVILVVRDPTKTPVGQQSSTYFSLGDGWIYGRRIPKMVRAKELPLVDVVDALQYFIFQIEITKDVVAWTEAHNYAWCVPDIPRYCLGFG